METDITEPDFYNKFLTLGTVVMSNIASENEDLKKAYETSVKYCLNEKIELTQPLIDIGVDIQDTSQLIKDLEMLKSMSSTLESTSDDYDNLFPVLQKIVSSKKDIYNKELQLQELKERAEAEKKISTAEVEKLRQDIEEQDRENKSDNHELTEQLTYVNKQNDELRRQLHNTKEELEQQKPSFQHQLQQSRDVLRETKDSQDKIHEKYIELLERHTDEINKINTDKLTNFNNIIINLSINQKREKEKVKEKEKEKEKDIQKHKKQIEDIKTYLNNDNLKNVFNNIKKIVKTQQEYINYIVVELP
jgi:chromosome segregation ATPase